MAYLDSEIELVKSFLQICGQEGPIVIDTQIAAHNYMLEDKLKDTGKENQWKKHIKEDKFTIGKEGENITPNDIYLFLDYAKKRGKRKVFDNGRSYFFEGIMPSKQKDVHYELCWGS